MQSVGEGDGLSSGCFWDPLRVHLYCSDFLRAFLCFPILALVIIFDYRYRFLEKIHIHTLILTFWGAVQDMVRI